MLLSTGLPAAIGIGRLTFKLLSRMILIRISINIETLRSRAKSCGGMERSLIKRLIELSNKKDEFNSEFRFDPAEDGLDKAVRDYE